MVLIYSNIFIYLPNINVVFDGLTILFLANYKKEGAFFIAYLLFLFWAVAFLYFW